MFSLLQLVFVLFFCLFNLLCCNKTLYFYQLQIYLLCHAPFDTEGLLLPQKPIGLWIIKERKTKI